MMYLFTIFLFSSLYLTTIFNSIGNIAISLLILCIFPILLFVKKNTEYKVNIFLILIMWMFLIFCLLSSLYNSDLKILFKAGVLFSLFLAGYIIIPSLKSIQEAGLNRLIYKSILYSQIPLIVISVLQYGLASNRYAGIFYNPNAFGSIAATLFVALLASFIYQLQMSIEGTSKKSKWSINLSLLGLMATFYFTTISGSRTSTLAVIGTVIIAIFVLIRNIARNGKSRSIFKGSFLLIVLTTVTFAVVKLTPLYDYFYMNILYKFQVKAAGGDVLDHRGTVWTNTISDAGFFGKGTSIFTGEMGSAHNTFVNILGENGWIPTIMFVLLIIISGFKSLKYAFSKVNDEYKYLPLMMITCFIILSMGESMMFKTCMISSFFASGTTLWRKEMIKDSYWINPTLKNKRTIS